MEIEYDDPLKLKSEAEDVDEIELKPQRPRKKVIKVDLTQDCFEEEGVCFVFANECNSEISLFQALIR